MASSTDFKDAQERIQKSLVSVVKTANRIAAEDLGFQRTVNPEVGQQLDDRSARILGLSTRLLQSAASACGLKSPPKLEEGEDIEVNWRGIVDVVDTVLEKADTALDEYSGLIKRKEPPTTESSPFPKRPKSTGQVIRNANIKKPQIAFDRQADNSSNTPWKPMITKKPHAKVPLDQSLITEPNDQGTLQYKHPYEKEISEMTYPERVYEKAEPIPYQPVDETQPTWVDTYDGVLEMLDELRKAKEIAVDLEHHDFRTYTGLVSLMQISTRDQDWIVDTLKPWRHKLEVLNEVFADPSIIKVFHGAYMDMVWLQRDLGLYVNGLFDTYFACELLGYPARSLAYLLSKFVNFEADKQYQLADWRMRPLPKEMLYYARSDTHYLLYIYDHVRNDLVAASDRSNTETDYIQRALERSRELSLSRNENHTFDEITGDGSRGWYAYILKHGHLSYDNEQFSVFKALWSWRDAVARKEDENPNFVLGSNNLSEIARANPPDLKALHSLLPGTAPLAKSRLAEIWELIQKAKAEGGPSLVQFLTSAAPESLRRNGTFRPARQQATPPLIGDDITVDRLSSSQLFGNMAISSRWEQSKETTASENDQVPFPWQRFVQQVPSSDVLQAEAAGPNSQTEATSAAQEASALESTAHNVEDIDEEFTLKRGKKRKSGESDDSEDESESDGDEEMGGVESGVLSLVDEKPQKRSRSKSERKQGQKDRDAQRKQERSQRKAERRQQQQLKKQEKEKAKQQSSAMYQAVPFDYSQAASVMNASRGSGSGAPATKEPRKVFDPYAKTGDDGMKGARKAPPIRGERSATFKK